MTFDWGALMALLATLQPGDAYAGIGSRQTPDEICAVMTRTAARLSARGLVLRSGGAQGADQAFERGVPTDGKMEIFLPWRSSTHASTLCHPPPKSFEIAQAFHPAWDRLSAAARKLMARNCQQVLGRNLDDPSKFVLCWTRDGGPTGGTGQAIRIAMAHRIPVFNLQAMARPAS